MSERLHRHLAAILAADVVGYSRLMEIDEAGTLARLKSMRQTVTESTVANFGGRIFKITVDGVLIEYPSAAAAVEHAIEVQKSITARESDVPRDRQLLAPVFERYVAELRAAGLPDQASMPARSSPRAGPRAARGQAARPDPEIAA